jgi:hypothetical protein
MKRKRTTVNGFYNSLLAVVALCALLLCAFFDQAAAATRFYLPSTGAAAVEPAPDAAWEDTTIAARLKAVVTKIASAMTSIVFDDADNTDRDVLFRQYVSDPIAAQTIAAQALAFQMRCLENNGSSNLYTSIGIRVVSNDGTSVRGTILAVTRDATEVVASVFTNRRLTATTTEVVAEAGDRIVIEVGLGGDPSSGGHDSSISIGDDSATDLGANDTDTAAYNPWVEFINTMTFQTTQSYAYPMAGGGIGGGSAIYNNGNIAAMTGGGTAGGSAAAQKGFIPSMSGGGLGGGAATVIRQAVNAMTGGGVGGGTATLLKGIVTAMTGGGISGGAATALNGFTTAMSGGAVAGGTVSWAMGIASLMTGGGIAGGIAGYSPGGLQSYLYMMQGGGTAGGSAAALYGYALRFITGTMVSARSFLLIVPERSFSVTVLWRSFLKIVGPKK